MDIPRKHTAGGVHSDETGSAPPPPPPWFERPRWSTGRGGAAAATWTFRGNKTRAASLRTRRVPRRRLRRRGLRGPAGRRVAAPPRLPRGPSTEPQRGRCPSDETDETPSPDAGRSARAPPRTTARPAAPTSRSARSPSPTSGKRARGCSKKSPCRRARPCGPPGQKTRWSWAFWFFKGTPFVNRRRRDDFSERSVGARPQVHATRAPLPQPFALQAALEANAAADVAAIPTWAKADCQRVARAARGRAERLRSCGDAASGTRMVL